MSLPAADDLFRRTRAEQARHDAAAIRAVPDAGRRHDVPDDASDETAAERESTSRKPSGRVRHDEKVTVYATAAELLELEHARLALRANHGLAVDRGRLVREALSLVLADFETHGEESVLIRRLTEE
ncbi:MAG: hypothetical protein ACR2JD_01165 [Nocardioides sp.]